MHSLVARGEEIAAIEGVLSRAREGAGGLLLVEGPAGIGKTSLLRRARDAATDMTVLSGTGTEFEREYPFGVVKQAMGPLVLAPEDRERLLTGAARLAAPALLETDDDHGGNPFAILNGLYWMLAALADERPVLLLVDDAHWADESTLRCLGFLARRVESIGVAIVVGARTEADFGAAPAGLAEVRDHARAHDARVEPGALDREGVAKVIAEAGGGPVEHDFAEACRRATGGNPFLLGELLRALRESGLDPSATAADQVAELSVPGVTRSVASTLERLGPDAAALAQAVAILGEGTRLDLGAALAELEPRQASLAAAALADAGILESGTALRFRHPILAGAVRDGLPATGRAEAHSRAAELLRGRGASADRVALQLLHVLPAGDERVVGELRDAARQANERGAPATAAMLLDRALAEPPPASARAELLYELGRAQLHEGRLVVASERLEEAYRVAEDPLARGRAAALLAMTLPGDAAARVRVADIVEEAYGEIEPLDRELALRLRAILVLDDRMPATEVDLPGDTVAEAVCLGVSVFPRMSQGASAEEIAEVASRGAQQADALLEEGALALAFTGISLGLRWSDNLDEAQELLTRAVESARRRGSTSDFAMAMTLRANVHRRAGRLREAEADARSALPAVLDDRWAFARGIQPLSLSLLDQGRPDDAMKELSAVVGEDDPPPDAPPMLPVLLGRMALHAGLRDYERALADWTLAVQRSEKYLGPNAAWVEDLVVAAEVHQALGDSDAARATAAQALGLAEGWGTPGSMGQALHCQARVGAAEDPAATLERAVALLAESPVRLEYAKALATLGGRRRREGRRAESRDPLREAYDIAVECGAQGLADAARAELRASGVRVKTAAPSGAEALTPSEQRIAQMAADGLSNAVIAQELFLTVKTVEMHLTQAYRKLDIRGRRELPQALEKTV